MTPKFLEATIDKFTLKVKLGLRYSSDHVWVKEDEAHCILGLTDYGQRRGGDIIFLEFPKGEGVIDTGEPVALYETIKAALAFEAPFNCKIVEVNNKLEEEPELVNEDPYGAGWIMKVIPFNRNDVKSLLTPEKYYKLMKESEA
jgi:glycine cleavage system H protein